MQGEDGISGAFNWEILIHLPAMGRILVGTSGYSYDDWVGPVYPPGTQRGDFLGLYAKRFGLTELNFTYYRQPTADGLRSIAAKTQDTFLFTIKAHQSLTHERTDGWQKEAEHFVQAIAELSASQLAGVLLQFPYSFHYTAENRRYLASVTDAIKPHRQFVEFRNDEWVLDSVWKEMERRELGLVIPDLPNLDRLPRIHARSTAPYGYIRFHGRNAGNWWGGTNVSRYDYLYSKGELQEWLDPIQALADQTETLIVTFNNHFSGQAVTNAEELLGLLGLA